MLKHMLSFLGKDVKDNTEVSSEQYIETNAEDP